jgi:hypothetical protein
METKTTMTEQDLKDAHPIADKIIALIEKERPAAAVAGVALALAATALLAKCGPDAPLGLYRHYYKLLEREQMLTAIGIAVDKVGP